MVSAYVNSTLSQLEDINATEITKGVAKYTVLEALEYVVFRIAGFTPPKRRGGDRIENGNVLLVDDAPIEGGCRSCSHPRNMSVA